MSPEKGKGKSRASDPVRAKPRRPSRKNAPADFSTRAARTRVAAHPKKPDLDRMDAHEGLAEVIKVFLAAMSLLAGRRVTRKGLTQAIKEMRESGVRLYPGRAGDMDRLVEKLQRGERNVIRMWTLRRALGEVT